MKHTRCPCCTCSITSMAWTKSNCLITGCSNGRLCYWSRDLKCIKNFFSHNGEIINVKLSCAESTLVTSGIDKRVKVFTWPSIIPNFEVKYGTPVKVSFSLICFQYRSTSAFDFQLEYVLLLKFSIVTVLTIYFI